MFVEPDFGLLHQLLSRGVITERDHAKIGAGESVYDRNDRLLHCLSSSLMETQYRELLLALEDTRQSHVANFICADGGFSLRFSIFTVRLHVMQRTALLSQFCPSVRLSVRCVYCDKTK